MIEFSNFQGFIGNFLRNLLKLIPKKIIVPILQGPAKFSLWRRWSSVDGCWLGSYEPSKQKEFFEHIKNNYVVYDIGAQSGFYTLIASKKAHKVYAFEPEQKNFENLSWHMRKSKNATLFNIAISDKDGIERFTLSDNPTTHHLDRNGSHKIQCRSIDSLVNKKEILPPDVIKIDVEGSQVKVLKGSLNTIKQYKPVIIAEILKSEIEDVLGFLNPKIKAVGENEYLITWQ